MNLLKRLAEITELNKSELAQEAGFAGRTYDLFSRDISPERLEFLGKLVKELEHEYRGRRFSRLFFEAIKRKVESENEKSGTH